MEAVQRRALVIGRAWKAITFRICFQVAITAIPLPHWKDVQMMPGMYSACFASAGLREHMHGRSRSLQYSESQEQCQTEETRLGISALNQKEG